MVADLCERRNVEGELAQNETEKECFTEYFTEYCTKYFTEYLVSWLLRAESENYRRKVFYWYIGRGWLQLFVRTY